MPCYGFRPEVGWSATMILTELQRKTIQAMVNIFETSAVLGRYAQVTLIPGDTGGLTYGRSQTTINSGNPQFGGFMVWEWTPGEGGKDDKGYTPENKPAEKVLRDAPCSVLVLRTG